MTMYSAIARFTLRVRGMESTMERGQVSVAFMTPATDWPAGSDQEVVEIVGSEPVHPRTPSNSPSAQRDDTPVAVAPPPG